MKKYIRLLQKAVGTPLFIAEEKLMVITDNVLLPMIMEEKISKEYSQPKEKLENRTNQITMLAGDPSGKKQGTKPSANDFAVINVFDTLTAKYDFWASGGTSYAEIKANVETAISEGYTNLLFYVDSPGGEAQGLFELTNYLRTLNDRGIFTAAYTDGSATSAAYAIAASTQIILSTQSAITGSIAAIMVHMETSKADAAAGRTYTIFRSKPDKAIPDSKTPLNEAGSEKLKSMVDKFDTMFNTDIVASRNILSTQDLIDMRGADYLADDALSLKLIDAVVGDINAAASKALEFKSTSWTRVGMSSTQTKAKTQTQTHKGVKMNEEELKAALEAQKAETVKAEAKAVASVVEERSRCAAIVKAANTLKMSSELTAKHIEKGYDAETSLDLMTEIAQAKGMVSATDSAAQATSLDPDLDSKAGVKTEIDRIAELKAAASAGGLTIKGVK